MKHIGKDVYHPLVIRIVQLFHNGSRFLVGLHDVFLIVKLLGVFVLHVTVCSSLDG